MSPRYVAVLTNGYDTWEEIFEASSYVDAVDLKKTSCRVFNLTLDEEWGELPIYVERVTEVTS